MNLSSGGKDADKLCYSANLGALSSAEIPKVVDNRLLSFIATGIEMAMFRDGATRLTTRAVDDVGLAYTDHGTTSLRTYHKKM